jgi:hypothetical protein
LDLASVGREACFEIKPLELEAWFESLVRNPGFGSATRQRQASVTVFDYQDQVDQWQE